jgi:K+-transporting ATPase ATPase C chain
MLLLFKRSVLVTALLALILCGVYPLLVTGVAQVVFPHQARGSLIEKDGKVLGSDWIGQSFTRPEYFHGRPSAAGSTGYDAASSSGSNLGPTNQKLKERIQAEVDRIRKENPGAAQENIPTELVTASGSGLDPHISPQAARFQVKRVAAARKLNEEELQKLIIRHTEGRFLGLLGEERVNVLRLNRALDELEAR